MSHEGGPESTQQRTVAELLAMYGGDAGERAPRRRRRRDDPTDTGPQAIIERVNSESAKLAPIRDDQPPPSRTSHRQRTGTHQPVPPPQQAEPRPAPPRPVAPPPRPAPQPPPRQQAPRPAPPPSPPQQAPPPAPAQTTQFPGIAAPESTRPVPPPRPQRRVAPQPPPQSMPSGSFPRPEAGPQGSGFFPAPAPPPPVRQNGALPEASTEQLPRIPQQPPAGRNSTGSHPVPSFPSTRTGFGPGAPAPAFGPEPVTAIDQRLASENFADPDADEFSDDRGADFQDYRDSDDLEGDDYDEDLDGEDARSAGREWLIMAGQVAISVVGGAAVWLGFNWLWGRFPQAALVAALVVIVGLVWIVRKIRRADDLQTTGLAVLVGLFVTVSPAALLLLGR